MSLLACVSFTLSGQFIEFISETLLNIMHPHYLRITVTVEILLHLSHGVNKIYYVVKLPYRFFYSYLMVSTKYIML